MLISTAKVKKGTGKLNTIITQPSCAKICKNVKAPSPTPSSTSLRYLSKLCSNVNVVIICFVALPESVKNFIHCMGNNENHGMLEVVSVLMKTDGS